MIRSTGETARRKLGTHADKMKDPETKHIMLRIAEGSRARSPAT
jgi:hypothetical protein